MVSIINNNKMSKYQQGKIYCIKSPHTNKVYVGSTIKTLERRMEGHLSKKNNTKSKEIIECGDAYIELIENYPCDTRQQLYMREGEIMRETSECINLCINGRTRKEYRELNKDKAKEYYETNKEVLSKQHQEYYEKNKELIQQQQKQYRQMNKDKIKQKYKEYQDKNRELINQRRRESRKEKKLLNSNGEDSKT